MRRRGRGNLATSRRAAVKPRWRMFPFGSQLSLRSACRARHRAAISSARRAPSSARTLCSRVRSANIDARHLASIAASRIAQRRAALLLARLVAADTIWPFIRPPKRLKSRLASRHRRPKADAVKRIGRSGRPGCNSGLPHLYPLYRWSVVRATTPERPSRSRSEREPPMGQSCDKPDLEDLLARVQTRIRRTEELVTRSNAIIRRSSKIIGPCRGEGDASGIDDVRK